MNILSNISNIYYSYLSQQPIPTQSKQAGTIVEKIRSVFSPAPTMNTSKELSLTDFYVIPPPLTDEEKISLISETFLIENCPQKNVIHSCLMEILNTSEGVELIKKIQDEGQVSIHVGYQREGSGIRYAWFHPTTRKIYLNSELFIKFHAYFQRSSLLFELGNIVQSKKFLNAFKNFMKNEITIEEYVKSTELIEFQSGLIHRSVVIEGMAVNSDYWPEQMNLYDHWAHMTPEQYWQDRQHDEHAECSRKRARSFQQKLKPSTSSV